MSRPADQVPQPTAEKKTPLRFVTAASLFDGHDAAINIMRRLIQAQGTEVIHLGHNRSVLDIVRAAIQEDADGIALSSYQGGHNEYFRYMVDQLKERGAEHIRVFGGGGGTITPEEIGELEQYGVERIYHPDVGMEMGLVEMIEDVVNRTSDGRVATEYPGQVDIGNDQTIANVISALEDQVFGEAELKLKRREWEGAKKQAPVVGITGTGGAGKSSVTDELLNRFLATYPDKRIAVLAVDPTRRRTGGALLGDRIRMNTLRHENIYMRSMATRRQHLATSAILQDAIAFLKSTGFDLVIVETAGIGQSDSEIVDLVDFSMYVMTSDFGAQSQLEKIDMLDYAELVVLNKFDRRAAEDALRDVRKQWKRNHLAFEADDEDIPVYPTIASQFNDPGITWMFVNLCRLLREKLSLEEAGWTPEIDTDLKEPKATILIPGNRTRYLAEIAEQGRDINAEIAVQAEAASRAQHYYECLKDLEDPTLPSAFDVYQVRDLTGNPPGADAPTPFGKGGESTSEPVAGNSHRPLSRQDDQTEADLRLLSRQDDPNEADLRPLSPKGGSASEASAGDFLVLRQRYNEALSELSKDAIQLLKEWPQRKEGLRTEKYNYEVRGREVTGANYRESLSKLPIPKIGMPRDTSWGELLSFLMRENLPGAYPYTAGTFPYRRVGEDPIRMFAGEGTPERTNRRFHLIAHGQPAVRLSTAFDSVTLYGEDPHTRPDIYGKVGNSGVSIATLDDMKKLYSGFDLCSPTTSVSMTINGPAPMILAFYMNAAVDQQVEKHLQETGQWADAEHKIKDYFKDREQPVYSGELPPGNDGLGLALLGITGDKLVDAETYVKIKAETLKTVRGTVQADILKEDQAQNTCIFSTEFALRMMGDIQQFFVNNGVRNFYSVSISGYHIAEAGANPISQLAFTLSNGFTIVEYYLARGMNIDEFAPNLSFFFSNGMDPEYTVIGRVARRIWARAMRERYGANRRSQMLKYHIQTSGRSLHAQEIQFNDIRTTLQALYALFDNCNSLHTNAYDEAITTPTEESVRRAVAIQMIINKELGLNFCENPWQGSFIVDELTDLVEEAVYQEFERISERGGVLGAMDTMYQRSKIQEESLYYESKKHDGSLPLVGVNTFLPREGSHIEVGEMELMRSTDGEKDQQVHNVEDFRWAHKLEGDPRLAELQQVARERKNTFEALMEAGKYCSLGSMSHALYDVGGEYRRNM
jgi:methylmalonyl-CoA mutase